MTYPRRAGRESSLSRRSFGRLMGASAVGAAVMLRSRPASAAKVWRLGFGATALSDHQKAAEAFAKALEDKTKGEIKVQIYPQSQLGGELQMINQLRTGTQEAMICAQAPIENTVKQYEVFDVPYLFTSVEQANRVMHGPVGDKFLEMLTPHGIYGLAWLSSKPRDIVSAKKAIHTPDDMKNYKIRVIQAPGYVAAYRAVGANPTPMTYAEVYLAMQQGTIDGLEASPDQMIFDKLVEVSKYYIRTRMNIPSWAFLVSKSVMDALPADKQKAVREAVQIAVDVDLKIYKDLHDNSLADTKKAGLEIIEPDLGPWKAATESARQQLVSAIPNGPELFAEISKAANAAG